MLCAVWTVLLSSLYSRMSAFNVPAATIGEVECTATASTCGPTTLVVTDDGPSAFTTRSEREPVPLARRSVPSAPTPRSCGLPDSSGAVPLLPIWIRKSRVVSSSLSTTCACAAGGWVMPVRSVPWVIDEVCGGGLSNQSAVVDSYCLGAPATNQMAMSIAASGSPRKSFR